MLSDLQLAMKEQLVTFSPNNYTETLDYIYFNFLFKDRKIRGACYSKNTGEVKLFTSERNHKNLFEGLILFKPSIGSINSEIIYEIKPYDIL